jgi:hypothetical protein
MLNLNKSVQILLDNKKITNISFNENEMNSFGYESLNEVFFDVFEIKNKNIEFIKEKKGDLNGDPIIELDLCIENQKYKNVRFVLKKNGGININPKLLDHLSATVFEQSNKSIVQNVSKPKTKVIVENTKPSLKKPLISEQSKILSERNVIDEVKKEFFNSIKEDLVSSLKEEIKAGIIADMLKENLQNNFDKFISQEDKSGKIYKLFEQTNNSFRSELMELIEKVSRREALRYAESGGGTNATQYANGGRMDGDLVVTGNIQSNSMSVSDIEVDTLSVNLLSANNEFIINNLSVAEGITSKNIDVDTLRVKSLSTDYEFVIYNLNVTQGISANSLLLYDALSVGNIIYSDYAEFYNLTINHDLSVHNNAYVLGTLSSNNIIIDSSLITDSITSNHIIVNQDLQTQSFTAADSKITNTLYASSFIADYSTINEDLSVGNNIITNYETVNNNLSVLGELYANQASINNDLTVGGPVNMNSGSQIFGDVLITGNLVVSNEIFGDLVSGNTIVNSNGDTLLTKMIKNITGAGFVNGTYTVTHNLSTYDLLMNLYYVNPNGTREIVHASMINDTLSTTQISFGSQPAPTDVFKLIIMS